MPLMGFGCVVVGVVFVVWDDVFFGVEAREELGGEFFDVVGGADEFFCLVAQLSMLFWNPSRSVKKWMMGGAPR